MVLLGLPPADHLLIERRDRGQLCLLGDAASLSAEIVGYARAAYPSAAAQTRIVSTARIRLDSRKSMRSFKEIICVDISEFESSHPSQAVGSLWAMSAQPIGVR